MSEHEYERWRHGGWYVLDVRYPSGAVGCVSRNFADRKWRIVCDYGGLDRTYPNRDAAADAEREIAATRCASHTEQRHACDGPRGHDGLHHSNVTSWDDEGECGGETIYPNGARLECWTCTHYLDRESSASRQHYIETGEYLRKGEAIPV